MIEQSWPCFGYGRKRGRLRLHFASRKWHSWPSRFHFHGMRSPSEATLVVLWSGLVPTL
jgi:hypothetical protein